jgi:hypothetical protein
VTNDLTVGEQPEEEESEKWPANKGPVELSDSFDEHFQQVTAAVQLENGASPVHTYDCHL